MADYQAQKAELLAQIPDHWVFGAAINELCNMLDSANDEIANLLRTNSLLRSELKEMQKEKKIKKRSEEEE